MDEPARGGDYASKVNSSIGVPAGAITGIGALTDRERTAFDILHDQLRESINSLETNITTLSGRLSSVIDQEHLGAYLEKMKAADFALGEGRSAHASQLQEAIRRVNELSGIVQALGQTVEV